MPEITTGEIKDFLAKRQGREVSLTDIRKEFHILPGTKSFDTIRNIMLQLAEQKIVRPSGKRDGLYKVITQVSPVQVYGVQRERRPLFELIFPRDYQTMREMNFAEDVVLREGDLITLGGVKSKGKTHLCINLCGENIDKNPVLMGNEYTVLVEDDGKETHEPAPRFLNRLDAMSVRNGGWIDWTNEDGTDKFTLLPVMEDYAEHIVKNRINIIDWVDLGGDKLWDIGRILKGIKANLGRGIGIVALQKGEGASDPRGKQFVRDYSDLEILLDGFGNNESEILLTIRGVKEKRSPIIGKTYAYTIENGVKTLNFREVRMCGQCHATGYIKGEKCDSCQGRKYVDCKIYAEADY